MSIPYIIAAALIVTAMTGIAHSAEFEIHPSISVSEEYNDNLFYTKDNRVTDYITHAMPGFTLLYRAPVLTSDISYTLDYMYYAKGSVDSNAAHNLSANGHLTAVENLLYLDVSDSYSRISQDITRDVSKQSPFANQVDQNIATVSPYITLRPTAKTKVKAGYRFVDIRYSDVSGGSAFSGFDKINHTAYLDAAYEFTPRWSATSGYSYTREESGIDDYNQHQCNVGFRYEYADKSFLFGQIGYTWTMFNSNRSLNALYWNAGFKHAFDTITATVNTSVKYDEDPLSNITQEKNATISLDKIFPIGTIGLSIYYSEYTTTETDTLRTRKYGGSVQGGYGFTSRLKGNLAFTAEKYDDESFQNQQGGFSKTYTRRYQVESGISYLLGKQFNMSLSYIYVDTYSPGIVTDNSKVDRVTLALTKTF